MTWKRPPQQDAATRFFATIWRAAEDSPHGEALCSPFLESQTELVHWVRQSRRDGDEVRTCQRNFLAGGGFRDVVLGTAEEA